jgi:hypothetical protein
MHRSFKTVFPNGILQAGETVQGEGFDNQKENRRLYYKQMDGLGYEPQRDDERGCSRGGG